MVIRKFPPLHQATSEGIVAVGGDLEPESLLLAYRQGIFPWPMPGVRIPWFCPPERAILEFDRLHISRSLARKRRKAEFHFTLNKAFSAVIQECAKVSRPGQDGTWITSEMIQAYSKLHQLGFAHSVEAWRGDRLVGGIYGVDADGPFAGESMFHHEDDASKLALLYLTEFLASKGLNWLDVQVLTPHLEALGACWVSREEFLRKLVHTQKLDLKIW